MAEDLKGPSGVEEGVALGQEVDQQPQAAPDEVVADALRAVEQHAPSAPASPTSDDGLEYYNDEDNGPLPEHSAAQAGPDLPFTKGQAKGPGGGGGHAALEAALAAKEAECADLDVQLKRMAADFENHRRREREGREDLIKSAARRVLENLVDVLDNFERALQAGANATEPGQVLDGVKLIHKQMEQFLSREGVEQIPAKGATFDPNLHEAVMAREVDDVPDQTVLEVFRAGYTLHGKVLRPSMVQVASNPSMPAAPSAPTEAPAAEAAEA